MVFHTESYTLNSENIYMVNVVKLHQQTVRRLLALLKTRRSKKYQSLLVVGFYLTVSLVLFPIFKILSHCFHALHLHNQF